MNILHKDGSTRGMFYIQNDGETVAEIVYSKRGDDNIVIEHTEVNEELQGKNIGFELVQKTINYARQHRLKVSPVCPFAKALFDKREDWKDVLTSHP